LAHLKIDRIFTKIKNMNKMWIPNTNITVKEFKKLLFEKFKDYPMMYTNYKERTFSISPTNSITQRDLRSFCKKLNINNEMRWVDYYSKGIYIIDC